MRYVPITREEVPVSGRPTSRSATLFQEFLSSDAEIWKIELDPEEDKTPESVRSSLDNYVVRHDLPVRVFTSAGQLFVEKSDTKPSERPRKPRKAKGEGDAVVAAEGAEVGAEAVVTTEAETIEGAGETEYAGV